MYRRVTRSAPLLNTFSLTPHTFYVIRLSSSEQVSKTAVEVHVTRDLVLVLPL